MLESLTQLQRLTRLLSILIATGALVVTVGSAKANVIIDFSSSTQLTTNFTETARVAGSEYVWSNGTGVGGASGYVATSSTASTSADNLFYTTDTFNAVTDPIRLQAYFRAVANTTASGISRNFMGFANNTGINLATENGKFGVRLFRNNTSTWTYQFVNATTTYSIGSTFTLQDGHWYQLTLDVTRNSTTGSGFDLDAELLDFGTDGQTLNPSFSRSDSRSITNTQFNGDPSLQYGLLTQLDDGGVDGIDNVYIGAVPEPATIALAGLGAAVMLVRRTRNNG